MNYEELYSQMQGSSKEMGDLLKGELKTHKSLCAEIAAGDLKSFEKDIAALEMQCQNLQNVLQKMKELSQGFDAKAYVESGDFAQQLLECCEKAGVDVKGDFPNYEMFPYKVRMDTENLDLYIDRKKVQCLRPQSFVANVKLSQDKLLKAPFNPTLFANELAQAYDYALLKQSAGKPYAKDTDCYLTSLYKALTPMRRFRKDYDQQSFAFDLARLYASDTAATDDGRHLQFGTSRNIKQAIRILDSDGNEQYLATIRFYQ